MLNYHCYSFTLIDEVSHNKLNQLTGLSSEQLARNTYKTLVQVCQEWKNRLPAGITSVSVPMASSVSIHAIKNTRRKMEDKHVVLPYFSEMFGLKVYIRRPSIDSRLYSQSLRNSR